MSRHRDVRNLTEDDYYDDYDDADYDDEYYNEEDQKTQQQYAPPPLNTAISQSQSQPQQIAVAGKAATTATVGVTKPPQGWGKPTAPSAAAAAAVGVAKPPPGWGKPTPPPPAAAATTLSSAGISKPPTGWGKPTAAATSPTKTKDSGGGGAKGVMQPPSGWGKPSEAATGSKTPPRSNNNNKGYTPKPLPEVLKKNVKSQLSMVVLGHVDAGKSTLMGQLLVQVGQVSKRDANKQGNLSWLLDENESERQRGVTMEIGTKGFAVPHHDIVILDAPGHADFIPVMITGAANADVAILVVAAVRGEFEAGFTGGGQTKEHVLLARGLGVTQVIVAVNKLDVEGWSQDRYEEIQYKVKEYLLQQEFKPKRIRFVALSGLTGENVKQRQDPKLNAWYTGSTLLEAIDSFQPANRQVEKPLRFIVTDIYAEGKGVIARGRVVQGFLQVGERLVVVPIGDTATVNKLEHLQPPSADAPNERLAIGMAGDTVELVLTGIDLMRISVGNILVNANARVPISKKAKVRLLIMDPLAVPIIRGAQVLFHMHSLDVPAVLTKLVSLTKRDGSIQKERPRALTGGASAIVEMTLSDKIAMEPFSQCRALGRFVLRRGGDTIAVGVIEEVLE